MQAWLGGGWDVAEAPLTAPSFELGWEWDSKPYACPLKTHVSMLMRKGGCPPLGQTDRLLETALIMGSGAESPLLLRLTL